MDNLNHQTLSNYSGSLYGRPKYQGIEYDWEVPDNLVVGTPGGVSTIHHHYTKGFNGRGNTSSDIYAGQGERYNSGIYGNLYQTGQEAGQDQGYYNQAPDYQFWQNQEPQQYSFSHGKSSDYAGENNPQKKSSIENYNSNFELIDDGNNIENFETKKIPEGGNVVIIPSISPWILFILFLTAFIAFSFWSETASLFIKQNFHSTSKISWKYSLLYSFLITLFFVLLLWISGVPLTSFEKL